MPQHNRTIAVEVQAEQIVTHFKPPLPEQMTFEATSDRRPIKEILHPNGSRSVSGVVYEKGDSHPDEVTELLHAIQHDLEESTGYKFQPGIRKLVASLTK